MMRIARVEAEHKIQLPAEWATELGVEKTVVLEKIAEGILVRPYHSMTWDEIFAEKLSVGQQPSTWDLSEVSSDDLLF